MIDFIFLNLNHRTASLGLNGNPFLWLEKRRQKDWEWKADKAAIKIIEKV